LPPAHARLYRTLLYQTLERERIRLPDLLVYLRTEPAVLEQRRAARAAAGDAYASTISLDYLKEIHEGYENLVANWRGTLLKYREYAVVPPDSDLLNLPAEIDMHEHPDYVHVAAGTIREKVRRGLPWRAGSVRDRSSGSGRTRRFGGTRSRTASRGWSGVSSPTSRSTRRSSRASGTSEPARVPW